MKTIANISKDELVKLFATRIVVKDYKSIDHLLDQEGIFDILSVDNEVVEVDKQEFMKWFTERLSKEEIVSIEYDQCLYCKIGNPVLLLNGGTFPVRPRPWKNPRSGLMIKINESGMIDQIQFCFTFLHAENKYGVTINGRTIQELLDQGHTVDEAISILKYSWGPHDDECSFPF
jgi:hypothetical protein